MADLVRQTPEVGTDSGPGSLVCAKITPEVGTDSGLGTLMCARITPEVGTDSAPQEQGPDDEAVAAMPTAAIEAAKRRKAAWDKNFDDGEGSSRSEEPLCLPHDPCRGAVTEADMQEVAAKALVEVERRRHLANRDFNDDDASMRREDSGAGPEVTEAAIHEVASKAFNEVALRRGSRRHDLDNDGGNVRSENSAAAAVNHTKVPTFDQEVLRTSPRQRRQVWAGRARILCRHWPRGASQAHGPVFSSMPGPSSAAGDRQADMREVQT